MAWYSKETKEPKMSLSFLAVQLGEKRKHSLIYVNVVEGSFERVMMRLNIQILRWNVQGLMLIINSEHQHWFISIEHFQYGSHYALSHLTFSVTC